MTFTSDERYYQTIPPKGLAERLLVLARTHIFQDFMALMSPSETDHILDVGVSGVINDGANFLEQRYPHPKKITACGLGDGIDFKSTFPDASYVRIQPNAGLPFVNDSFDVATSNAVLEHVGSLEHQILFVNELCRVARRVFISVPNRYFPIEHHTALPFVHYNDAMFRIASWISGKSEWAQEENLILMSRGRLWQLAERIEKSATVGLTGLPLGLFSSNLYLMFR
jgi:hypothetical protein